MLFSSAIEQFKSVITCRSGENLANLEKTKTYDMPNEKNGFAVIINNYEFRDHSINLDGGADDTRRLKDTFEGLKFIVDSHENKDADDMKRILFECKFIRFMATVGVMILKGNYSHNYTLLKLSPYCASSVLQSKR